MFKGYPRLSLGVLWLAIGGVCLVAYLTDHEILNGMFRRYVFVGLVGVIGGPIMALWGAFELMLRPRVQHGGVFERDGFGANNMADVTDALSALAKADAVKPSDATIDAATNAINTYFDCALKPAAVADRIKRYSPTPKENLLDASIRQGFPGMDDRFRADFIKAAWDVARADGAISLPRAKVFAILYSAVRPPAAAVTSEMRALLETPNPALTSP